MISFLFMMTVRALVTDAGEVVVVSQFLQSQLCRQLGVEVADPRLGQRGDLLGGGDGQVLAGEGDHTVRLTLGPRYTPHPYVSISASQISNPLM